MVDYQTLFMGADKWRFLGEDHRMTEEFNKSVG